MMMQPQFNVGEKAVYPTHGVAEVVALETKVIEGNLVRVMSWYDNEWGFSNRMADTAVAMSKLI